MRPFPKVGAVIFVYESMYTAAVIDKALIQPVKKSEQRKMQKTTINHQSTRIINTNAYEVKNELRLNLVTNK